MGATRRRQRGPVMRLTRLTVAGVRNLQPLDLAPGPRINLVLGANGAGKTSLLEAIHLLAYGRSFRGRVRDGLVRTGSDSLEVFAEWTEPVDVRRRAGLRHTGQSWTGRLDGEPVQQLGELCAALAAVSFEPGSHALVTAGSEARRRYLDWGLFHVEQGESRFQPVWRRYTRALKQRNALLKGRQRDGQLDAWEAELDQTGTLLTQHRERYLGQLQPYLAASTDALLPEAGATELVFQPGWRREELPLADALLLARDRDLATGFTSVGPHRADWRIVQAAIPGREALSRGQAKLTALAALLAQAEHQAAIRGDWPVVALDDLASELDRPHQQLVLRRLWQYDTQVLVTGTDRPAGLEGVGARRVPARVFHVEQGMLRPA